MSGFMYRSRGLFALRIRKDFNYRRVQETVPALRWLRPKTGERILDIGCGEGTYNYRIALRGAQVFGFDLNQHQLRRAAAYHKTPSTGYFCADASAFPLRSGQFDTVISLCVFEHLPNDRKTLQEMWRVLRPDGRILLTLDSLSLDGNWRGVAHRAPGTAQRPAILFAPVGRIAARSVWIQTGTIPLPASFQVGPGADQAELCHGTHARGTGGADAVGIGLGRPFGIRGV